MLSSTDSATEQRKEKINASDTYATNTRTSLFVYSAAGVSVLVALTANTRPAVIWRKMKKNEQVNHLCIDF
jgi:hypothetical protein